MKILKMLLLACTCLFLLCGCWDQNLLKDIRVVLATGVDLTPDGKVIGTSTIPLFASGEAGSSVEGSQVISAQGDTVRDTRNELDDKISRRFDSSKLVVFLMGEAYAKQDIYAGLDVFYRDPKGSLVENIAVVKGEAIDLLNLQLKEKISMGEYLDGLFESAQASTFIPRQTRPMFSDFFDPGTDIILPLIEQKEKEAQIIGLALFNGRKYTGQYLNPQESMIYMLMADRKSKEAWIKVKVHDNQAAQMDNFIYINVLKLKRDLKINAKNSDHITIDLLLNLKVEVTEYAKDHLDSTKVLTGLEEKISEQLTKQANHTIKKMQEAHSDSLSIGRQLIAFHHDTWENIDWKEEYPNANFKAKVNVEVTKHGVFN
ncbi:Ger(x)C family spore germination protein [Paenibacillus sp. Marseille-Q4541]|uniref:Ger(x)C family spore germination protein n=1 Tax=Paenibacillus sp. Marseille-Q4541 TaxID=2831522 RepID=UPI001BA50EB9|nr:Ger(x)C family spore germination protein [Paenibacillus sp. Marseille-Q4541]